MVNLCGKTNYLIDREHSVRITPPSKTVVIALFTIILLGVHDHINTQISALVFAAATLPAKTALFASP